jgi:uncharacterized protein
VIVVALVACGGALSNSGLETATLDVGGHAVKVEIASTNASRQRGLMYRDSLGADRGMLFVYRDLKVRRFWMKDTRVPLSIAFADRGGRIVRIEDLTPFDTESTSSVLPAQYALEMNQGWFAEHGVDKGAIITGIPTDLVVE